MKILFGTKYFGKDISEVPSGYLIWIIESYEKADWLLINECKKELSARLKLDWLPPTPEQETSNQLRKNLTKAETEIAHLKSVIMMSTLCRGNPYTLEQYLNNPEYMQSRLRQVREYFEWENSGALQDI